MTHSHGENSGEDVSGLQLKCFLYTQSSTKPCLPCFVVMTLWWVRMFHNGRENTYFWWLSSKSFHRMLVNNLLQANVEWFVMLAFWRNSPTSRMFHSRRVKLSLATLALHIFSSVGCRDVRNFALQLVEIVLVDWNLNFKPFPSWQGKIHWHFELSQ